MQLVLVMLEAHLVPDSQYDDVGPRAVFERAGSLTHQALPGEIGVVVCSG